jgi:hypothetical protein
MFASTVRLTAIRKHPRHGDGEPAAFIWTSGAERLQAAGRSLKVCQEFDNLQDNLFRVLKNLAWMKLAGGTRKA